MGVPSRRGHALCGWMNVCRSRRGKTVTAFTKMETNYSLRKAVMSDRLFSCLQPLLFRFC